MKRIWTVAVCAVALTAAGGEAVALAAEEPRTFDPLLSLRGDCGVSKLDEVPDPGPCPGVPSVDHPPNPFTLPVAVTTDAHGDIYVSNTGLLAGWIDVFDAEGNFVTEVPDSLRPVAIAVDSKGNLYVVNKNGNGAEKAIVRYSPTSYEPASGEVVYPASPTAVVVKKDEEGSGQQGIAINTSNDHLFVNSRFSIKEFKAAAEENELVETFANQQITEEGVKVRVLEEDAGGLALDLARGRIYASTRRAPTISTLGIRVFELAAPHNLLFTIRATVVPAGKFESGHLSLAVDEATGHLFVYDGEVKAVYELEPDEALTAGAKYLGTLDTSERKFEYVGDSQIAIDNGALSPNGVKNPKGRYLFVPAEGEGAGHAWAFGPPTTCKPDVESISFANVGEAEAELRARVEPCGLATHYIFQYLPQTQFEAQGGSFEGAQIAGEGDTSAAANPLSVAAVASNLAPGTRYRFRVVAVNEKGEAEPPLPDAEFATYPGAEPSVGCPNEALRTGLSALLPDCRAFELVSPAQTNAHPPLGAGSTLGVFFSSPPSSPDGNTLSFRIEGGAISGSGATGSLAGDPYVTTRGSGGWHTSYSGPDPSAASTILPGSTSPDQGYSFWTADEGGKGSALVEGKRTRYVRYPDGHSALVGRGSLGTDQNAIGKLISVNGGHIIFESSGDVVASPVRLEPEAPEGGTRTVYDRTSDEVTHVVSLLPGSLTPAEGEDALYEGASLDGRGVAFSIGARLYLRYEDAETYEVGEGVDFAGVAEGGSRVFYLEGGDLYRYDALGGQRVPFTTIGNAIPVNISADGAVAYFLSQTAIGGVENPNGQAPVGGGENLYRSREGIVSFVGTVTGADVEHKVGNERFGLGVWAPDVAGKGEVAKDPSRTTADGSVLLFESRAQLGPFDPEGHIEVYRYDANQLSCLSCNPTLAQAGGDATLLSATFIPAAPEPLGLLARVANLSTDGRRAFFQSDEALVPGDTDGLQDVYEWEAQGRGDCTRPPGCIYLISSGHSGRIDYLFGASDSGDDVFFRTSDLLLGADLEETPSIYDARVGGGFAEPVETACRGEGCRPTLSVPPALATPGMLPAAKSGNLPRRCPKSTRRVKRQGKVRCVKKHRLHKQHRKHHQRKASSKRKAVGK